MDEYDDGPYWAILLMYGSHVMRHIGFRRLTVVNGTPGFWGVTSVSLRGVLEIRAHIQLLSGYTLLILRTTLLKNSTN